MSNPKVRLQAMFESFRHKILLRIDSEEDKYVFNEVFDALVMYFLAWYDANAVSIDDLVDILNNIYTYPLPTYCDDIMHSKDIKWWHRDMNNRAIRHNSSRWCYLMFELRLVNMYNPIKIKYKP
jgi:hypothetical protein